MLKGSKAATSSTSLESASKLSSLSSWSEDGGLRILPLVLMLLLFLILDVDCVDFTGDSQVLVSSETYGVDDLNFPFSFLKL